MNRLTRATASGGTALLAAFTVGSLAQPATALAPAAARAQAADHTPPTLTVEPFGRYDVGSAVDVFYYRGRVDYWFARYQVKWTTSDPSGICKQTVTENSYDTLGGDPDPVLGGETVTYRVGIHARTYDYGTEDLDEYRVPSRFVVRTTDCAGNTATSAVVRTAFGIREDKDRAIEYRGSWRTSRFEGFTGGTTHASTKAGDSVQLSGLKSGPLGLVMEAKADRGKVDVYFDGALRATVDTGSMGTQHRTVVWQAMLAAGRTHTLKVVNRGTPGRPRVDIDAVLTGNII